LGRGAEGAALFRPQADLLSEEICLSLHRAALLPAAAHLPLAAPHLAPRALARSLHAQARRFVATLQADKAGSVHTILRTALKVAPPTRPNAPAPAPPIAEGAQAAAAVEAAGAGAGAGAGRGGCVGCERCGGARAAIKRPKDGSKVCRECFLRLFEDDVHATIRDKRLFSPGERVPRPPTRPPACAPGGGGRCVPERRGQVCIAASGGKDSTVLAEVPPSPSPSPCPSPPSRSPHASPQVMTRLNASLQVMTRLNARHAYGLDLFLLSIDEGIQAPPSAQPPPCPLKALPRPSRRAAAEAQTSRLK